MNKSMLVATKWNQGVSTFNAWISDAGMSLFFSTCHNICYAILWGHGHDGAFYGLTRTQIEVGEHQRSRPEADCR